MIILGSETEVLRARLATAPANANPAFSFAWGDDGQNRAVGNTRGTLNGTSDVDLVASPQVGYTRVVRSGFVYNADSAAAGLTIEHYDGTTAYPIAGIELAPGYTLTLGDDGFRVTDATGAEAGASVPLQTMTFQATAAANVASNTVVSANTSGVYNPNLETPADVTSVVGIAFTSATTGNPVTVMTAGTITEALWNWAQGPIYCALTGGALTQTVPASGAVLQVGVAISPQTIRVGIQPAILRSS